MINGMEGSINLHIAHNFIDRKTNLLTPNHDFFI
jgi:hypothetical protein